jgi:HAD domain in Swiss Army Knife RNA repair proteins
MNIVVPPKQKIIFLDVDGPLINEPMFDIKHDCSIHRSMINTMAIGFLRRMMKITGAKIVMNTMHNGHIVWGNNVKQDLLKWGLREEDFMADWQTKFGVSLWKREEAIHEWLIRNGDEFDWIALLPTIG